MTKASIRVTDIAQHLNVPLTRVKLLARAAGIKLVRRGQFFLPLSDALVKRILAEHHRRARGPRAPRRPPDAA